jgi:hypothetical protein
MPKAASCIELEHHSPDAPVILSPKSWGEPHRSPGGLRVYETVFHVVDFNPFPALLITGSETTARFLLLTSNDYLRRTVTGTRKEE